MNKDEIDKTAEREGRALKHMDKTNRRMRSTGGSQANRINQRDTYGKDKFEKLFRS